MTEQQSSHAAVEEIDPDSDSTDATESMILSEGEEEGSRTPSIDEEEGSRTPSIDEEEGSRTPSIQEEVAENQNLESPEIRRRRTRHQVLDSDEDGEDGPSTVDNVQEATTTQHDNEVVAVVDLAPSPAPSAQVELQAPGELQHPLSLPETLAREPSPPPSSLQEPSNSQQQQQEPILPIHSEEGDVPISHPEDAGLPLETTLTIPSESHDILPPEAGPSTSTVPPDGTSKNQLKGEAAPEINPDCEDEGQICSICFEPWSNMGDHHLACLKCGHLFGFKCIIKWLEGPYAQKGRCPQCNTKASKKDVRKLYAKNIIVVDTTEKERIQKDLEKEREERRKLEVEYESTKLQYKLKNQQLAKLLKELEVLKASVSKTAIHTGEPSSSRNSSKKRLVFNQFLDVCRKGDCRVMAFNEWLAMLVVSMPSQVEMFPGFGIKKINMMELRVDCYVPLHQQQIRDLAFNPTRHDMLLSVAIDRLVKITNIQSNAAMGQFVAPGPVWCCSWSTKDPNMFYVGTSNGHLIQYDTRHIDGPVGIIDLPGRGPVVSLAYIHPGPESSSTCQGLLVARLQQCFFVEEWLARTHTLRTEGNVASVSCVANSCHVLVSFRPSPQFPHARHAVCTLHQREGSSGDEEITINLLHTFQGGTTNKVLTRSLLTRPSHDRSSLLVCAGDESTQNVFVWDVATLTCLQQLHCSDTIVDILQMCVGQTVYLAALTNKGVRLYQWTT